VLAIAQRLFRESDGAFDVTIAPVLARRGLLPSRAARPYAQSGRMDALRLLDGSRVHADVPLALDLGGIAKGFAVDRAIDALRAAGATCGIVNAGGDLRVFGDDHWLPVRIRHPAAPGATLQPFALRDAAVATSGDYFRAGRSALVDPRSRRGASQPLPASITVVASTCVMADALTKIVALRPAGSAAILADYGAHAFTLSRDGARMATTCAASTANLRLALAAAA
jgi:FAD:protein FMN transferase